MIPRFPEFKLLELSDREEIQGLTNRYIPYSDFNFTSMWSWDTDNKFLISALHDNLVVRFIDYITAVPFYSFIGHFRIEETISTLIDHAKRNNVDPILRLIPEEIFWEVDILENQFLIEADRDGFDYLLNIENLLDYRGNKLRGKRNFTNRFIKLYNPISSEIDITNPVIKEGIMKVVDGWVGERSALSEDVNEKELKAIQKILQSNLSNIVSLGVFLGTEMVGFVIGEKLANGYSILHFEKAISKDLIGIYPYMMQHFAKLLAEKGCIYINYEQDLGILGLRTSKESFQPILIRKHTIKEKK